MTRLEVALAWWPAVLRYGGFGLMGMSFLLYVVTFLALPPPLLVPTPFLLTFGSMMAIGEGGRAIKDFANSPTPKIPGRADG